MKTKLLILISLLAGLLGLSMPSRAYDIDIYSGNTGGNTPNLMFVIDSSANGNASMGACAYDSKTPGDGAGGSPSLGNTTLGNEQCALVNIVQFLPVHSVTDPTTGTIDPDVELVKLGITTSDGVYRTLIPINDKPYGGSPTVTLGKSSFTVPAGSTNRQAFILAVKGMGVNTSLTDQGDEMQETWAYYTGGDGMGTYQNTGTGAASGTTYTASSSGASTGCQKNYALYLGGIASSSHVNDALTATKMTQLLVDAVTLYENSRVGGSFTQTMANNAITKLTTVIMNGAQPDKYAKSPTPDSWAREWARFMFAYDMNTSTAGAGLQSIITYAISVGTGNTDMANFINDMATVGGGKYYAATSYQQILNDILAILNEVQAVNSVFSSSSLPVSVNAQGTFLNQIYMGMFRPDANGNPRWKGNLKQYQFIYSTTAGLQLGDSLGRPAISGSGTGFISANAISFWTCSNTKTTPYANTYLANALTSAQITTLTNDLQNCTDPLPNGMWANDPDSAYSAGIGYDLPDGEMVYKGGSAQQIRQSNLSDDYTQAPGSSANPRRMYTWCPGGAGGCSPSLTSTGTGALNNVFDTSNGQITDAILGTGTRNVSSIVSAPTVTPSSTVAVAYPAGTSTTPTTITITSFSKAGSTVTATVSASDYALISPASAITISLGTKIDCTSCAVTPSIVTTTHAGVTTTTYQFTYTTNTANTGSAPASASASLSNPYVSAPYTLVTVNATAHGLSLNQVITFAASGNIAPCTVLLALNNTQQTINSVTANSFTVMLSPSTLSGTDYTCQYSPNTATVTTAAAHGFKTNDTITIAGAGGTTTPAYTGFNGAWSIVNTGTYTFTYQYTANAPLASVGSGPTAQSAINRDTLLKWMRGADIIGDGISLCPPATVGGANGVANVGNCPAAVVTIRPSVHGDVLHSRPTVLNYGYDKIAITGTSDSGSTRTAYVSASDGQKVAAAGANPVVTFASGDACAVTVDSSNTFFTYTNTACGNSGAQSAAVGSKVVVYYGDNHGVFHAINGNRSENYGAAGPGDEMWGFVAPEFYGKLLRLANNSPSVKYPSTPTGILPTPQPKDWFVDGSPGIYQTIDGNGTTQKAIIYLAMRRGVDAKSNGFIYALDVTDPLNPQVLWKVDKTGITDGTGAFTANSSDYGELGQTWSMPKVALVAGYCGAGGCSSSNPPSPVLIFGAGYDTNEDADPPTSGDASGRGIFVLDALTGAMVWKATYTSGGGTTPSYPASNTAIKAVAQVPNMYFSIPSDITLVSRHDANGYIDRLYAADTGGNIWRVDLAPSGNTPNKWQIYQLAALGTAAGECTPPCSNTPRKFFYPPEVIAAGTGHNFDAVIAGSGDREHPLYASIVSQRVNRLFLLKDTFTGNDASGMSAAGSGYPITMNANTSNVQKGLFDATTTLWDGTMSGYFITLGTGEKVVNAPLVAAGYAYMSTNQPGSQTSNSCVTNLGTAYGYQLSPFTAESNGLNYAKVTFAGGGLPPSPVAGVVDIVVNGVVQHMPFLIGAANPNCTGSASDCSSALGGQKPPINVPTTRHRIYRYIKGK